MEKKDSGQLMEKVFANLYNLMVPSSLDDNEPSVKLLSIMLLGITLGEELDPEKAKGKELLNLIADRIPKVSKNYVDSGKIEIGKKPQIIGIISTVMMPGFPQMEEPAVRNKMVLKSRSGAVPSVMERLTSEALRKRDNCTVLNEESMKEIMK
ncbi:hypothetical protein AAK706_12075 [Erysipelotrichaceae bacterium 66-17]|uniref:hypothetical protein n=1 Tax=uncultured Dubosiella sp. TaxID=1937011 RepID=UPI00207E4CBD|nr:hypothetical protein [uncultured Dubosiella sp.]GJM57603.1 hypothetical protein EROP_12960 [Erysipelotrichaceae bacterium OPF54]